jgi:signal transduction histidine kinase/CheY-like chemotaxis protein
MACADFDARPLVTVYSAEAIGQDAVSWRMVEDARHFLYFGTNTLLSFDGSQWRSFPAGHAYAIRGLDAGADGRIWAAGTGELGWFERGENGAETFRSLLPALPAADRDVGELWAALRWQAGAVFAGANTLYWWNGREFTVQRFPGGHRIVLLREGADFYVSQSGLGLRAVTAAGQREIVGPALLDDAAVQWLERLDGGGWLVATSRGLFRLEGGRAAPLDPPSCALIRRLGLTAVLRLPDRRLAVATLRGGILLLGAEGRLEDRLNRSNGLPTDEVFSLASDHEGGLWATSSSNIARVSLQRLRWYRDPAGDQPVAAMVSTATGLCVATDTGVYRADAAGEHLRSQREVMRHCWALVAAGSDLLLGSSRGLERLRPDGSLESLLGGRGDVSAIALAPEGGTAVVAAGRNLLRVPLQPNDEPMAAATLPEAATALALGPGQSVWVGTMTAGVLRGRLAGPGQAPLPLSPAPWPGNSGPALVVGRGGSTVYAFVGHEGWAVTEPGPAVSIAGFPPREVGAAEAEADGVWVVHPSADGLGPCVAWVGARAGRPTWQPRLIEGLWRVGIPECIHAETVAGLTRLWVGGTAGILRCDLDPDEAPPPIPPLVLTVRTDDGAPLAPAARVPYSAGEMTLSVELASYALRPALRGETRIDPIEQDWTPLEPDGRRKLAALRDGRYLIRARVRATTGQTSAEVRQAVIILPPWRRRWFTAAGLGAALLGAGYGWHRWRSRVLRARALALEQAVRRRTREVEHANAEKTRFVAGISHDIRNPLNGIVGLTLALESSALDPRQRELTNAMRGCAKYLDGLVEEVIDFAQIEAGRAALRPDWYSPAELLDEVIDITRAEAELNGATLRSELHGLLPARVLGDGGRVRQILVNLTFNAIRHAGGAIELHLRTVDGPPALEFAVADAGPGIAADDQPRLFEPFSRLEAPGKTRAPGSGLGLATSRRWAEIMGGTLTVASQLEAGSRFSLTVPFDASLRPADRAAAPLTLRRALLVEDEDYNAWAAEAVAARVGLHIAARAKTGAEALAQFAPDRFDVVLLDRVLPDLDGTAVCRALRAKGATVKIIALTASATAEDRAACLAAGMDEFVSKPLTPEKLAAVLRAVGGDGIEASAQSVDVAAAPSPPTGLIPGTGGSVESELNAEQRARRPRPADLRLLRYLADGTPEGEARELQRYQANLRDAVEALQLAMIAGEAEVIRGCAHRLHGFLRMIEAQAACAAAEEIELSALRGQVPAEALAEALAAAIAELGDELCRAGDSPQLSRPGDPLGLSRAGAPPQNPAPAHNGESPRAI